MIRVILATTVAALALAMPARADDKPSVEAQKFGARENIVDMTLSPDGSHASIVVADAGQSRTLMIADLVKGGLPTAILKSSGAMDALEQCKWANDTRLVCRVHFVEKDVDLLSYSRMLSLNIDGSDLKLLTSRQSGQMLGLNQRGGDVIDYGPDGASGSVLVTREFVPEFSTGSLVAEKRQGLGVELVNATTLSRKLIESPAPDAIEYISDGHGTVRIRAIRPKVDGYDGNRILYTFRKPGSREWQALSGQRVETGASSLFVPYAVDGAANLAYGFDDADGHNALYSVTLDDARTRTLLIARPDVDVESLIQIGRNGRVVGASWVTDRREQQFFDPELQKLRAALSKVIPNRPLVSFIDASADEKRILLLAGADNDPGTYYVFDKTTRHLEEVAPARPELAGTTLATVRPVTYPAADGTQIPAYLTLPPGSSGKNLPAIVMPHGGPDARDEWGFDWLAQFYAARGFAVIQPNFRGSTGYGEAWFQKNGFQSWKTAIGDVNDAGRWLLAQGIAASGKLAIVGWSYGGYAALQTSVADPDLFKAIVAVAPVTDLDMYREESRNFTNFYLTDRFIGHGAHVREGSPLKNAERIKAPVLMFHGDVDRNVGVAESRAMASRLKELARKVDYVEFKGLDHQLDDAAARTTLLDRSDKFLREALSLGSNSAK